MNSSDATRQLTNDDFFRLLLQMRSRGTLSAFDRLTGHRVDVDVAIELDCGPNAVRQARLA